MKKYILLVVFVLFAFFSVDAQNSKYPEMIVVEGGTFKMGSTDGYDDEKPVHKVTISDYSIGKYEITVGQYKKYCKETGAKFPGKPKKSWYDEHDMVRDWSWRDNHPIVNVTWYDALDYCEWLSEETGDNYTLPTESQWEFAARGGTLSKGYEFSGSNTINSVAWYDETTYERGTKPVGQKTANELGIYDMSGNAFEWCLDFYGKYAGKSSKNPSGAKKGQYKTVRGGSWYYVEEFCRTTQRDSPKATLKKFNYGFRVVKN
jgi:formylglycine-generating enzyme required for sulfatase activity